MAFSMKNIGKMIKKTAAAIPKSGAPSTTPRRKSGLGSLVGDAFAKSSLAGKAVEAKKGGMIKKKAASDMAGRALKRTTADAKGRAMKMKKGGSAKKGC